MDVEILYIDDCPNWRDTGARLRAALDLAGRKADAIRFRRIATADEAANVPFAGSPTILLDGVDPFRPDETTTELACRLYWTPSGPAGSPTVEQLAEAIRLPRD